LHGTMLKTPKSFTMPLPLSLKVTVAGGSTVIENDFWKEILSITLLSLRVSGTAVSIGALIGVPLGVILGFSQFKGKRTLIRFVDVMLKSMVNTFMGLPPVVVGLLVYLLLTTSGPLGWLGLLYTPTAMIITQLIMGIPIIVGVTMSAIGSVEKAIRERALSLGATETQAAWLVLKEARMGVLTSIIVAFGAAISEVGGIMITGGNIRWWTRTLTTAIVVETGLGNFDMALTLGAILLSIAFIINLALTILQLKGERR
jgi:tungstate transport system permease protein